MHSPHTLISAQDYPSRKPSTNPRRGQCVSYLKLVVHKGETKPGDENEHEMSADQNPMEASRQRTHTLVLKEIAKDKSLAEALGELEAEFAPYKELILGTHPIKMAMVCAGAYEVITHVKRMLKPGALESIHLTNPKKNFLKSSFADALEIVKEGDRYRMKGFSLNAILVIATYLNSMIPAVA